MNWEAMGAIGEIVGAIAVLATIFYLSIQVGQNTRMVRSSIKEQRTASSQHAISLMMDCSGILAKFQSGEELIPEELIRIRLAFQASIRGFETYYYQYRKGLFDKSEWEGIRNTMKMTLTGPAGQEVWEQIKTGYSEGFQSLVADFQTENAQHKN